MTYVSSGDVRIHVRILSTYVFYRRMFSIDVRVLSTYVFNRRTYFVDVRASATYVFGTTRLEIQIRDKASRDGFGTTQSKIMDSGLRSRKSRIRDYAEHSGLWI